MIHRTLHCPFFTTASVATTPQPRTTPKHPVPRHPPPSRLQTTQQPRPRENLAVIPPCPVVPLDKTLASHLKSFIPLPLQSALVSFPPPSYSSVPSHGPSRSAARFLSIGDPDQHPIHDDFQLARTSNHPQRYPNFAKVRKSTFGPNPRQLRRCTSRLGYPPRGVVIA